MLRLAANALPVIDIAPFLNADSKYSELRTSTATAIHKACIEYGFFYLDISAYVDPSVPEHLAHLGRQFFALPQVEKDKITLSNQDYARGKPSYLATTLFMHYRVRPIRICETERKCHER